MFQFDQNLPGASFAHEERLAQARTFDEIGSGDVGLLDVIRQSSREVGMRRWLALRARVGTDG
ncbi:hypothetical protein ACPZ19_06120 [Amycolatopsis lurida]